MSKEYNKTVFDFVEGEIYVTADGWAYKRQGNEIYFHDVRYRNPQEKVNWLKCEFAIYDYEFRCIEKTFI